MISLAKKHPELVSEWSDKNGDLTPKNISYGSNRKVWWNGKCGHSWIANIKNRSNGSGCPYCTGNRVLYGVNDLETGYPEIASEWSEKNLPLQPSDVTVRANKKVWWKCHVCGYEWQTRIADRSEGHGCPACAGAVVFSGYNDLATRYPELVREWAEENGDKPSVYSPKSRKKVLWRCGECGCLWESVIDSRVKGRSCPFCTMKKRHEEANRLKTDKTPFMIIMICEYAEKNMLKLIFDDESEIGVPLKIYFPETRVAIEFSDHKQNRGSVRRWEYGKNMICGKVGIRMIRIMAPGTIPYSNCECFIMRDNSEEEAYETVKTIVESL
jgi:rubrerythrin